MPARASAGRSRRVLAPLWRVRAAALRARAPAPAGRQASRRGRAGGDLPDHAGETRPVRRPRRQHLVLAGHDRRQQGARSGARARAAGEGVARLRDALRAAVRGPGARTGRRRGRRRPPAGGGGAGAGRDQPALPSRADAEVHRGPPPGRVRRSAGGQDRDVRRSFVARAARVPRAVAGGDRLRFPCSRQGSGDGMKKDQAADLSAHDAPNDALEAAALLRQARAPIAVPAAAEPIVAAQAAPALEALRTRGRRRARLWIATSLLAPAAAAVWLLTSTMTHAPQSRGSAAPPAPTADLLAAQAQAARGGPGSVALARLDVEMRAYRRQYHAGLRQRLEETP